MKSSIILTVLVAALALAASGSAAVLTSGCAFNSGNSGPFTCDLFEVDAAGNPSQMSAIVTLPVPLNPPGFIVLLEHPNSNQNDPTQWSDVVVLDTMNAQGFATTAQLLSDGCNCFTPTFVSGVLSGSTVFAVETQTGTGTDNGDSTTVSLPTTGPAQSTFIIHSDAPVNDVDFLPEPTSMSLLGLGGLGLALVSRIKRR